MPVENLPHWTILPNWRAPVLERLECLTAILASPSGAEQRYAARWSPRRMFEPLVTPVGRLRTLFDMAVGAVGVSSWYLPIWHDAQTTTESLGIGDTALNCETLHREFKAGGFVMLWRDEFTSEVLEVASVSSGALTFVAGPAAAWPAGTRLFPAVKARLTDMPDMARRGPRAIENAIRFMVETENDFADANVTLPYPTYGGFLVLTTEPDESQDITHGRMRLLEELDSDTGLSRRYDTAGIDFTIQRHHWLNVGRQEHAELRTLFYTLDGRRNLLWLPTFADDFEVVAPALSTDAFIEVAKCGFTAFGGAREGRDRVWINLRSGTNIFREIVGSSLTIDGTENIQLDSALGVAFDPDDVAHVSFITLSRLDSDTIEIEHYTDINGSSRVAMTFRSAPNIRSALNWTPPGFLLNAMTDGACGGCTPATLDLEIQDPYWITAQGSDGGNGYWVNSSSGMYGFEMSEAVSGRSYSVTNVSPGNVNITLTKTGTLDTLLYPQVFLPGIAMEVLGNAQPYYEGEADLTIEIISPSGNFTTFGSIAFVFGLSAPAVPPASAVGYPFAGDIDIASLDGATSVTEFEHSYDGVSLTGNFSEGGPPVATGTTYAYRKSGTFLVTPGSPETVYVMPFIEFGVAWEAAPAGAAVRLRVENMRFHLTCSPPP